MHRSMELGAGIQVLEATLAIADCEVPIRLPVRPSCSGVGEESIGWLAWVQPAKVVERRGGGV